MSIRNRFSAVAIEADTPIGPHGETVLHLAAKEGDAREAAKIIAAGATVFILDKYNSSPLVYAVQKGDAETVRVIAQSDKKGLDWPTTAGTALGIAAQNGNIAAAEALLEAGAKIDAPDDQGETPLMNAVYAGHKEMVEFLLSRDADANILRMGEGALHLAARKGNPNIIRLLLEHDAIRHINEQTSSQRMTPLHIAVLTGEYGSAAALLEAGALTNLENSRGETPVALAALQGDAKMIRLLVEQGHADLRATGGDVKWTPLHRAALGGKLEAVQELVRLGADPLTKDSEGRTAADIALRHGKREVAEFLQPEDYVTRKVFPKSGALSP